MTEETDKTSGEGQTGKGRVRYVTQDVLNQVLARLADDVLKPYIQEVVDTSYAARNKELAEKLTGFERFAAYEERLKALEDSRPVEAKNGKGSSYDIDEITRHVAEQILSEDGEFYKRLSEVAKRVITEVVESGPKTDGKRGRKGKQDEDAIDKLRRDLEEGGELYNSIINSAKQAAKDGVREVAEEVAREAVDGIAERVGAGKRKRAKSSASDDEIENLKKLVAELGRTVFKDEPEEQKYLKLSDNEE